MDAQSRNHMMKSYFGVFCKGGRRGAVRKEKVSKVRLVQFWKAFHVSLIMGRDVAFISKVTQL